MDTMVNNNNNNVFLGESRGIGAYCHTAKYKGGIVRIKELKFDRKKDISRYCVALYNHIMQLISKIKKI